MCEIGTNQMFRLHLLLPLLHRTNMSILIDVSIGFWMGTALWKQYSGNHFKAPLDNHKELKSKNAELE